MNPSNKEMQLRKTCQLYAYVLESLGKEVPEYIEECAESYEYPANCFVELSQLVTSLDSDTFNSIVNNTETVLAHDLSNWWKMYQTYTPIDEFERS